MLFSFKLKHHAVCPGVEMLPVYLSISGNFRKWQVKNIAVCHRQQATKSLVINLLVQN